MKKYFYGFLMAVTGILLTACSTDEGQEPGNDSQANAVLYVYNADLPNDPDCDALARIATNSATSEVYILAEEKAAFDQHMAAGEAAMTDYVVSNGTKVEGADHGALVDKVLAGLKGSWGIATVAVGGGAKKLATAEFTGLSWNDVCKGTYKFSVANVKAIYQETVETTLQQNGDDPKQYRFKNLFGPAQHLAFYVDGRHYADGGAVCRVPAQATPLVFGNYGGVNVRDVALWQGDEGYLDCALYEDGSAYFWVQYYVTAGNMGYGYDEFTPAN